MIRPKEFAALHGVHYLTVMKWLRRELIDGAETHHLPGDNHYYLIPRDAKPPVLKFGRPKKDAAEKKK